jgi:hypothetical protein
MLAKVQAENRDTLAYYYYAGVQAQWGNVAKALEWLETGTGCVTRVWGY